MRAVDGARRTAEWVLVGVVLLGVGLRWWAAQRESLWLDELHTLEIARPASWGESFEILRKDVHAPLHFLFCHALGVEKPHRLRLFSMAGALLALLPLLLLASEARLGRWALTALVGAALLLPYQIRHGLELRPYGWLQTCAAFAIWAAFSGRGSGLLRAVVFALAVAVGLHVHYLMAACVLAIGAARLLAWGAAGLAPWKLIAAGTVGVCAFLPWVVTVESWIFEDPSVMVRDEKASGEAAAPQAQAAPRVVPRAELLSLTPRTLAPTIGRLGVWPGRAVLVGLALCALALAASLLPGRKRSDTRAAERPAWVLSGPILACALHAVFTALVAAKFWGRVPIQYFAPSALAWPLLFATLIERADRNGRAPLLAGGLLVGLLLMGVGHVAGASREDLRAGVRRAEALAGDTEGSVALTAVMRQPPTYRHEEVFAAYPVTRRVLPPLEIPPPSEGGPTTVVVVSRKAPPGSADSPAGIWEHLLRERAVRSEDRIDSEVTVRVLSAR